MTKNFAVVNTEGTVVTVEASGLLKAVAQVVDIIEAELGDEFTVEAKRQNTRHVYPIVVDVNVYNADGQLVDDATVSVHRDIPVSFVPFKRDETDESI